MHEPGVLVYIRFDPLNGHQLNSLLRIINILLLLALIECRFPIPCPPLLSFPHFICYLVIAQQGTLTFEWFELL